jgi:hypothetical protein
VVKNQFLWKGSSAWCKIHLPAKGLVLTLCFRGTADQSVFSLVLIFVISCFRGSGLFHCTLYILFLSHTGRPKFHHQSLTSQSRFGLEIA